MAYWVVMPRPFHKDTTPHDGGLDGGYKDVSTRGGIQMMNTGECDERCLTAIIMYEPRGPGCYPVGPVLHPLSYLIAVKHWFMFRHAAAAHEMMEKAELCSSNTVE